MKAIVKNTIKRIFHPFISPFIIFIIILLSGQYDKARDLITGILFAGSFGFGIHPVITGSLLAALALLILQGISWIVNKI